MANLLFIRFLSFCFVWSPVGLFGLGLVVSVSAVHLSCCVSCCLLLCVVLGLLVWACLVVFVVEVSLVVFSTGLFCCLFLFCWCGSSCPFTCVVRSFHPPRG